MNIKNLFLLSLAGMLASCVQPEVQKYQPRKIYYPNSVVALWPESKDDTTRKIGKIFFFGEDSVLLFDRIHTLPGKRDTFISQSTTDTILFRPKTKREINDFPRHDMETVWEELYFKNYTPPAPPAPTSSI